MISSNELTVRWANDPVYESLLNSIVNRVPAIEWVASCPALTHPHHHGEASDLRGIPLAGQQFNEPDYDLSDSILCGADFSGAVLHGTWLQASILDQALFRGARLKRTQLLLAYGKHVDFTGAAFDQATLKSGKVIHSCFDRALLESSDFSQMDLSHCSFANASAKDCRFDDSTLEATDLLNARFTICDFSSSVLRNSRLEGTSLVECDMSGTDFRGASLAGTEIRGGRFGSIENAGLVTKTRFDDTPAARRLVAKSGAKGVEQIEWHQAAHMRLPSVPAGKPCPRAGYWFTPAKQGSRRHFQEGELMPSFSTDYGATLWQWDEQQ